MNIPTEISIDMWRNLHPPIIGITLYLKDSRCTLNTWDVSQAGMRSVAITTNVKIATEKLETYKLLVLVKFIIIPLDPLLFLQTERCSGRLLIRHIGLQFWPGYRLSWLKIFVILLSLSTKTP
jgi:hypothetical protein